MNLKQITGLCVLSACLNAQTSSSATSAASSGPPVYVLYRLFFRDIAALDAAAAQADAAGQPGGDQLRGWYQGILLLTSDQVSALKQDAAACNQALDQLQQTAQPVIAAAQRQNAGSTGPFTIPPQLAALDQQRTNISLTCIQNLQSAMGHRKFQDIDVFVRTKFAQKVSKLPPANAPFANAPAPTHPAGGGK